MSRKPHESACLAETSASAPLTIDDELAVYCPECAEREFGGEDGRDE